jgi:hypothetical protein
LVVTGAAGDLTTEMRAFIHHSLYASGVTSCLLWFPWWSALTSKAGFLSTEASITSVEEDQEPDPLGGTPGSIVMLPRKPWHRGHHRGVITAALAPAPAPAVPINPGSKRQALASSRRQPASKKRRKNAAAAAVDNDTETDDIQHVYLPPVADEEYWGEEYMEEYEVDEVVGKEEGAQPVYYMEE